MILFTEGSRYSNLFSSVYKGFVMINLSFRLLFCFVSLIWLHFSNPRPQNALFPVFLWIDLQKDATGNCLWFSLPLYKSLKQKHVLVGNLIEEKIFIFPCLIHKIKEVFSQKCSKVSRLRERQ